MSEREVCETCHRPIPVAKSDDPTGPARERISITVPRGEEGVLDEMLILLVERYADAFPEDAREAREGAGLALVGSRAWRYRAIHFAVFAALDVGLVPTEEG